jgi:N-acetylmuramoyl-L-alanine amidase/Copper amine oxidase N-terminal domain
MSIVIQQRLIPDGSPNKPSKPMTPQWITIHNTDNTSGTAESHARYLLDGSGGRQASWHYTVDDKDIYQHLRDNEQGWHAGDGNGPGNTTSIGIEVCMYTGMNQHEAWNKAAWLVATLILRYKLTFDQVVPHKNWSGKQCPSQILPYWSQFIILIKGQVQKLQNGIRILVNGQEAAQGILKNNVVYGPIRDIATALGLSVGWDNTKKIAYLNNISQPNSIILNGSAYVPVRAIAESIGASVTWNGTERIVSIQRQEKKE